MSTAFSAKILALLQAQRLSYRDAAPLAGVSLATFERWINKGGIPRLDEARALAVGLGVSVDYLADDDQAEPAPGLTAQEQIALDVVRQLGPAEAIRRMVDPATATATRAADAANPARRPMPMLIPPAPTAGAGSTTSMPPGADRTPATRESDSGSKVRRSAR